jgi:hypothetical protein
MGSCPLKLAFRRPEMPVFTGDQGYVSLIKSDEITRENPFHLRTNTSQITS